MSVVRVPLFLADTIEVCTSRPGAIKDENENLEHQYCFEYGSKGRKKNPGSEFVQSLVWWSIHRKIGPRRNKSGRFSERTVI